MTTDLRRSILDAIAHDGGNVAARLSPQSCSQWLNMVASQMRLYDGVSFWIERNGADR